MLSYEKVIIYGLLALNVIWNLFILSQLGNIWRLLFIAGNSFEIQADINKKVVKELESK